MKTFTATASQIGKSKNEGITANGVVFIKSCKVGLWNYLVISSFDYHFKIEDQDFSGNRVCVESKHRTIESAEKSLIEALKVSHGSDHSNIKIEVVEIERK